MSSPDAIVVGAGIVGAACAEALARDGRRVLVLDAAYAGGGATAAAMGHLVVMDDSEAQFALTSFSRRLWEERVAELPADCEDDPCGTLWVAADDDEMEHVRRKARFYVERGVSAEILDEAALREAHEQGRPVVVRAADAAAIRAALARPEVASVLVPPGRDDLLDLDLTALTYES